VKPGASEEILWSGRPSFWNWWVRLLIGDLSLALAAVLWWIDESRWIPPAAALAAVSYLAALAGRMGVRYTLTNQRVIARTGLLSKRLDEVEIVDIRNIVLEQSFFERLCGIGTVGIASAGGDGIEVRFEGIKDALQLKERIRQTRLSSRAPSTGETDAIEETPRAG
jgi:uncharacterized membrane protein YdbT with pleckstrin-like domain